jgi:hypothetical protein
MATPSLTNVVHPFITSKHTKVLQLPPLPPQPVTQLEVATLLSLRNRSKQIEEQIAEAERSIRTRLEAGGYIEPGEHSATLKESFRRSVSWREVAERIGDKLFGTGKGDSYCERVLRSTKPARTVSLQIS